MTFDEARAVPRLCCCGQHLVTGGWHNYGCCWYRERLGRWGVRWACPDREVCE